MATVNLGKVVTTPKGNYVSSTPYDILDEVYDDVNNITYVSLKDANTDALTTTTSWMVIAKGIGVTTDNNYIDADKAKVTALPSAAPGEVDGLALYNTLKTFTDSKGIAGGLALYDTLAAFMTLKGAANGIPTTNASNQVIQDATNALSLGGNLAANYPTASVGVWTPVLNDILGVSLSHVSQFGRYEKLNKKITIMFFTTINGLNAASGQVILSGLPFIEDTSFVYGLDVSIITNDTSVEYINGLIDSSRLTLRIKKEATQIVTLTTSNIPTDLSIWGTFAYFTS